jgi:glycosyltransferase involved in cell wall biosynthesis
VYRRLPWEDAALAEGRLTVRVLFVSRTLPNPNGSGVERRAAQHLATLRRFGAVTLVIVQQWKMPAQMLRSDLVAGGIERLIIRNIREEPTRYEYYLKRWQDSKNRLSRIWYRLRVTHECDVRPFARDVERRRREIGGNYDLLFAFRMPAAIWIDSVLSPADRPPLSILDFDDIESVAYQRLERMRTGRRPARILLNWYIAHWLARRERELARSWTRVVVCSEHDREVLRRRLRVTPLVVPNSVRFPARAAQAPPGRVELLFVGQLTYPPNVQGVCWLVHQVWPALRDALGDGARVTIAGMDPCQDVLDLAAVPGVEVLASVPDLGPLYERATISVAPIFAGGGTRIKLIEAMARTRAIVTTRLGCEGLPVTSGRELLMADTPQAFVAAVLELARDPERRRMLAENGWDFGRARYSDEVVVEEFAGAIQEILGASARTAGRSDLR